MKIKTWSFIWHLRQAPTKAINTKLTPKRKSVKEPFRSLSTCSDTRGHPCAKQMSLFYIIFDRRIDLLKQKLKILKSVGHEKNFCQSADNFLRKKIIATNNISNESSFNAYKMCGHAILLIFVKFITYPCAKSFNFKKKSVFNLEFWIFIPMEILQRKCTADRQNLGGWKIVCQQWNFWEKK